MDGVGAFLPRVEAALGPNNGGDDGVGAAGGNVFGSPGYRTGMNREHHFTSAVRIIRVLYQVRDFSTQ